MEPSQITHTDTICAISTPPGVGGIAVIRISGPEAITITQSLWQGTDLAKAQTHTAHLGTIVDTDSQPLDQCVATIYRAPKSYTGQDTVELSVHGSTYIQRAILDTLTHAGARIAQPGEYTRRAFAAGKLNLAQAEAVADIIAADSRAAHHIAVTQMRDGYTRQLEQLRQQLTEIASLLELELDFTDQDVEFASRQKLSQLTDTLINSLSTLHDSFATGHAIRTGIPVAIIGPTNAGKSSLLNALLGHDRAIVSDIHGTTRDTIDETINIGDYTYRLIDTAGLRHTDDPIEQIGIDRTHNAIHSATIILRITDATSSDAAYTDATSTTSTDAPRHIDIPPHSTLIDIRNKVDLLTAIPPDHDDTIHISARTGHGIDTLKQRLIDTVDTHYKSAAGHNILVTNARHAAALHDALQCAQRVHDGLACDLPADLLAQDIRQAISHLAQITGAITTPDILTTIFTRFCIGK